MLPHTRVKISLLRLINNANHEEGSAREALSCAVVLINSSQLWNLTRSSIFGELLMSFSVKIKFLTRDKRSAVIFTFLVGFHSSGSSNLLATLFKASQREMRKLISSPLDQQSPTHLAVYQAPIKMRKFFRLIRRSQTLVLYLLYESRSLTSWGG